MFVLLNGGAKMDGARMPTAVSLSDVSIVVKLYLLCSIVSSAGLFCVFPCKKQMEKQMELAFG